ncbi:double-cubane-cluster-containing anaerobic reductase [Desulfotomaculum copahuensis]|uniref:3-hydroxyacyl-ACP dehydratase n=1 Tax=Desulfotomaculum copahuensis TaxID=1838280 RepID=A0A1B7LGH0_9FIRM|nr:double-cubane-cluster-containing anaerobic reductase [Desulfotomaculum copahuensis]OAT85014.1 3-hydroxyacyl-ACP dehydratase [Desulfotomaculum copahuensis]
MTDYRRMWSDLNMDLEKHDQLMNALPLVYEDVFLRQAGRPRAMDYFDSVVAEIHSERIAELQAHKNQGGKICGAFCVFVPVEIARAAGAIAVGLCGGSQFWVPDGEKVLPRNLCPLIKASVGARLSGTCPYFQSCDLLIGETTCDGKKKAWEVLNEYAPVYVMDLPQMKRPRDLAAWREETGLFLDKMEELTGQRVTAEKLAVEIRRQNRLRRALERLYRARQADPVPVSGKDALLVTQVGFYDDPDRFIERTEALAAEAEERIAAGEGVFGAGAPRILVTGTPMAIPNWKLHHIIESAGAAVVGEETCTGTRFFAHQVDEGGVTLEEQLQALAERYLKINCSCFTPNPGRIEDILRLVGETRADGVVYYNLQFCHGYAVEYHAVEKALKERGIPVMKVETDYGEEDTGQLSTRVEAFIEMLR